MRRLTFRAQFLDRVAKHGQGRWIQPFDLALFVDGEDSVGGGIEDGGKAGLVVAKQVVGQCQFRRPLADPCFQFIMHTLQRFLGATAFGDVKRDPLEEERAAGFILDELAFSVNPDNAPITHNQAVL